jgi:hypothetical protein
LNQIALAPSLPNVMKRMGASKVWSKSMLETTLYLTQRKNHRLKNNQQMGASALKLSPDCHQDQNEKSLLCFK